MVINGLARALTEGTKTMQKTAHLFPLASDAALAVAAFDAQEPKMYQYEITLVRAADFTIQGFEARVKDLDGFGVGYVHA